MSSVTILNEVMFLAYGICKTYFLTFPLLVNNMVINELDSCAAYGTNYWLHSVQAHIFVFYTITLVGT